MSTPLLQKWHTVLSLPHQTKRTRNRSRLLEELSERHSASTFLTRLSKAADILFTVSRVHHDGFTLHFRAPWSRPYTGLAKMYMLGNFTPRWGFYRVSAYCTGKHYPRTASTEGALEGRAVSSHKIPGRGDWHGGVCYAPPAGKRYSWVPSPL
jgi:hypothetical protein